MSWASQSKASFNAIFEQPVRIAFQEMDEKLIFVPVNWLTDQDIYQKVPQKEDN